MMLQPGARPVPNSPDYMLIRKLGAGAFGEVWHAHGPGGLDVALKFVRLESHLLESRLPPMAQRTEQQLIEIEREAYARQGQMLHSGVFERLERAIEANLDLKTSAALTAAGRPGEPPKGVYPPPGVEPLEYDEREWEMLTAVPPDDEKRQPLPD